MELIRDKDPRVPDAHQADLVEYYLALRAKLQDEVTRYLENKDPAILADIAQVLKTLAAVHGLGATELEDIRRRRALSHGGYVGRWVVG